ncbi:MAG TPA: hypothetical protein VIJ68_00310 [Candidatus Saccharimonadales bacterium]
MRKRDGVRLNCFSPPVMLATIIIELSLAVYTAVRYKMSEVTRLITFTLVMLASFQICEFFVCTGPISHAPVWSRLGFAAISVLPPLGVHILHVLAGKKDRRLVWVAYATMVVFVAFFLIGNNAFFGYKCTGNYVIFQVAYTWGGWFTAYYYGWLAISFMMGIRWANELMSQGKKAYKQLQTVRALMIGWLVFIVPTVIANTIKPQVGRAIPSVMCGFAVLFALILGFYILPRTGKLKRWA